MSVCNRKGTHVSLEWATTLAPKTHEWTTALKFSICTQHSSHAVYQNRLSPRKTQQSRNGIDARHISPPQRTWHSGVSNLKKH
jgi:hypothetical protein